MFNDELEEGFKPIGVEISEKKSFHEHKFRAKYMLNEYSVRKAMMEKEKAKKTATEPPPDKSQPQEGDEDSDGPKL